MYNMQFTPIKTPTHQPSEYEREISRADMELLLKNNPGKIIVKFGATWCGPCKRIESQVVKWYDFITNSEKYSSTIQCIMVDVDESFDLYGLLKSKRQINGIPAILCYHKDNVSIIPDSMVVGADPQEIDIFFNKVLQG